MGRIHQIASGTAAPLRGGQDAGAEPSEHDSPAGSREMSAPVDVDGLDALAQRLADPVARRVIEMIKDGGVLPAPAAATWLNATEVAQLLHVTREWVYQHADELGAVRLGGGRRPRLRFRREGLATAIIAPTAGVEKRPKHRETRSYGLIPIDDSA
jgi:hypothetical protein